MLVSKRVSDESLMVGQGVAAGWPDWWSGGAVWEARRLGRCTTSRRCARLSSAGQGRAFSPTHVCCRGGSAWEQAERTRGVVGRCAGRQARCFRYGEARGRCGFDQSSMRSGRDSTAPRDLSKAFLESFNTCLSQVDMTLARRRHTRTFGSTRSSCA